MPAHASWVMRVAQVGIAALALSCAWAQPRPITVDDLLRLPRVADVQLSPDGHRVAYTLAEPNLETNEFESHLWIVETAGGNPRQLTHSGKDRAPRWSPDGKQLAFLSRRDGSSQVYLLNLKGGEARAVTHLPSGVETLRWSPDGATLIVSASVDPACADEACHKASAKKRAEDKDARIYDRWPIWNALRWGDGTQSHLLAIKMDGSAAPRDLTPGKRFDVPPRFSVDASVDPNDIAVSPDGKEVCFVSTDKPDADGHSRGQLFRLAMTGGEPRPLNPHTGSAGGPRYSPDGRFIAYRLQVNSKNTGAHFRVMLYRIASGETSQLTSDFDRSAFGLTWSPDSRSLYFTSEEATRVPVYALSIERGAQPKRILEGSVGEFSVSRSSPAIAFTRSSLTAPSEVFVASSPCATPRQLTHHGEAVLSGLTLATPERFEFKSADATAVQALFVPPPTLDPQGKYPLLVLLHGGPHTMWSDLWNYRWNAQVFAAQGYGVLMINRRGSTGYGQAFSDGIIGQWGGTAYTDIMNGIDEALARYRYLDPQRIGAAGASYGGYMANWIATHSDRFKVIVSHAGVYNLASIYLMDLPWFLEYETGGTPWAAPEAYAKWSPSTYAGMLGKFKTPMLVTTGDRDFRVPYTQSLELYAALQRQGVPSKLLVFPEEGHWILKSQNSKQWYDTVIDWLGKFLKTPTNTLDTAGAQIPADDAHPLLNW